MYCAIVEFCLANGVDRVTVVCEDYWFARFASLGWKPVRLGAGVERDGELIVGLINEMSADILERTCRFFDLDTPVLIHPEVGMARAS